MHNIVEIAIIDLPRRMVETMKMRVLFRTIDVWRCILVMIIALHFLGIITIEVALEAIMSTHTVSRLIIGGLIHTTYKL
jgi:hypothetical protein